MKTVEEIAGMVTIRNHLQSLRDRSLIRRSDYQSVNSLIQQLDQDIINSSMELFKQQSSVQVEDELNISKKIAEAKAKLLKSQNSSDLDNPNESNTQLKTASAKPRPSFKKKAAPVEETEVKEYE